MQKRSRLDNKAKVDLMATSTTLLDQRFDVDRYQQCADTPAEDREALQMIAAYLEPLVADCLAAGKMDTFYRTTEVNLWKQAEALFTELGQAVDIEQKGTFAELVVVEGRPYRVWMEGREVRRTARGGSTLAEYVDGLDDFSEERGRLTSHKPYTGLIYPVDGVPDDGAASQEPPPHIQQLAGLIPTYLELRARGEQALHESRAKRERIGAIVHALERGTVPQEIAQTMAPLSGITLSEALRARFAIAPGRARKEWVFDYGTVSLMRPEGTGNGTSGDKLHVFVSA
jgi:hypothetical protein